MKQPVRAMPLEPTHDMIEAAHMLIETMKGGTPERNKRIVAEIWKTMAEYAPPPRASGLTRLQQRTHEIIADYIDEHGMAPNYDEIGAQLNKGRSDVYAIVHALKRRGVLTVRHGARRSIRLIVRPGEQVKKERENA